MFFCILSDERTHARLSCRYSVFHFKLFLLLLFRISDAQNTERRRKKTSVNSTIWMALETMCLAGDHFTHTTSKKHNQQNFNLSTSYRGLSTISILCKQFCWFYFRNCVQYAFSSSVSKFPWVQWRKWEIVWIERKKSRNIYKMPPSNRALWSIIEKNHLRFVYSTHIALSQPPYFKFFSSRCTVIAIKWKLPWKNIQLITE